MLNSPAYRALLFRLRISMFSVPLLAGIFYFRWLAPRFGPEHVKRVRVAVPRGLTRLFLKMYRVRPHVTGLENLVAGGNGARILMVNHNSRFDAYVLLATLDFPYKSFWSNTAHVTSEGFYLLAWFGRAYDMFFVHDKSDKRRTLAEFKRAEQYLLSGGTLSMFPEGSYSTDGLAGNFGQACTSLAVRTGAVIVPVALSGTSRTYEKATNAGSAHDVDVQILPPIRTAGLDRMQVAALTADIVRQLNAALQTARTSA